MDHRPHSEAINAIDPELGRLLGATERHLWDLPRLSIREKVIASVVADVCNGTIGLPFERNVHRGLEHGVSTEVVRSIVCYVAFETGYDSALAAAARLSELERQLGITPVAPSEAPREPLSLPPEVRATWRDVDEGLAAFLELQASLRGSAPGVSVRERAFAALTCDLAYQTLDETFAIHIGRAVSAGAQPEDLRALLWFNAGSLGVARVWNGFRALRRHLQQRGLSSGAAVSPDRVASAHKGS